ncbi:putative membrane protein [Xanthomonas euvesicatoria pv. vesicatoria str. 85-10]|nr:putative membrane protein [Xanthomonas euvesicatoria pv. vesicatoria str. 85-10]
MRSRPTPTRTERRGSDRSACAAVAAPRATIILFNDSRSTPMWYFAWILGTGLAALAAVLNGMWFEAREPERGEPPQ